MLPIGRNTTRHKTLRARRMRESSTSGRRGGTGSGLCTFAFAKHLHCWSESECQCKCLNWYKYSYHANANKNTYTRLRFTQKSSIPPPHDIDTFRHKLKFIFRALIDRLYKILKIQSLSLYNVLLQQLFQVIRLINYFHHFCHSYQSAGIQKLIFTG